MTVLVMYAYNEELSILHMNGKITIMVNFLDPHLLQKKKKTD